jgi:hypothetical protein
MPLKSFQEGILGSFLIAFEVFPCLGSPYILKPRFRVKYSTLGLSGTIIRGTLKAPNSQLVTPISIKLQRPDGCD